MFSWFGKVNYTPHTKVDLFAEHLKNGYLMGSRCKACGFSTYPPRADCPECMAGEFEFVEWSGKGRLMTFTKITAAPTGFEDVAPYTIGLVDLEDGGRLVGWFGDSIPEEEQKIGMDLQVVPRLFEDQEEIQVYYTLEKTGTTWGKVK